MRPKASSGCWTKSGTSSISPARPRRQPAALADEEHLEKTLRYNATNKRWLEERLRGFGFELSDSVANFVLAKCSEGNEACARLNQYLRDNGVSVKPGNISGLPDCLRITVGPREALDKLIATLESYFAPASKG